MQGAQWSLSEAALGSAAGSTQKHHGKPGRTAPSDGSAGSPHRRRDTRRPGDGLAVRLTRPPDGASPSLCASTFGAIPRSEGSTSAACCGVTPRRQKSATSRRMCRGVTRVCHEYVETIAVTNSMSIPCANSSAWWERVICHTFLGVLPGRRRVTRPGP